jgi:cytoskeleton protein RodZ
MTEPTSDGRFGAAANTIATAAELAAVREARGWSIQEAAHRMRLAARQILALEQGQWQELPGGTFVRGALRGYGRLLGVNVEPLIETLGDAGRPSDLRPAASLSMPMPRGDGLDFSVAGGGRRNRLLLALVIVAAIVAYILFFGRTVPLGVPPKSAPSPSPAAGAVTPLPPVANPGPADSVIQREPAAALPTVIEPVPTRPVR